MFTSELFVEVWNERINLSVVLSVKFCCEDVEAGVTFCWIELINDRQSTLELNEDLFIDSNLCVLDECMFCDGL